MLDCDDTDRALFTMATDRGRLQLAVPGVGELADVARVLPSGVTDLRTLYIVWRSKLTE
jgi:hypothetical protein